MKNDKMLNLLFLDKVHPFLENKLKELGHNCDFDLMNGKDIIENKLEHYDGIIMRSRILLDEGFIDKGKRLKFIAREGVGVEHIPVDYAASKGVNVITSPEGSRDTVAEHAVGMMLMLLNNLSRADREVKNGQWKREGNRAIELMGMTVGILGYGNMGSSFAKRLFGFGVKVIAYDKFKRGFSDSFAKEVLLEQLFSEAQIISIHIPYSTENHYFINDQFMQNFNRDFFLINTARGLVLNTADLVKNLKLGKVRGAALDVLEYEDQSFDRFKLNELPEDFHYLTKAPNVILTPHIAGWSFESKLKHAQVLAEKIEKLFL